MQVRRPKIDYANIRAHWAPNHEFAQDRNATSTIPTYVEPYLIRVMRRAKDALPESETALRREIDWFIGQESQHFQQHNAFNARIREAGYPKLAEFEMRLKNDYVRFLSEKSLKFNLAYSEGFESMGPPAAEMWFDHSADFLDGADPEAVALWKWHMAEEFEHRDVCFRVYKALFARTFWGKLANGWLYRCYGLVCAIRHLGAYGNDARAYVLEVDRAAMTAAERARSEANEKAVDAHKRRHMLPGLLKCFSPFYNPAKKREPAGLMAYLRQFEEGGTYAR